MCSGNGRGAPRPYLLTPNSNGRDALLRVRQIGTMARSPSVDFLGGLTLNDPVLLVSARDHGS